MNYIANLANDLAKKYNTRNPWKLSEHLDSLVKEMPLGTNDGFYVSTNRGGCIIINSDLSYEKKTFVLCHEIGHTLLHPNVEDHFFNIKNFINYSKIERHATLLAAHFMIDNDLLINYKDMSLKEISMIEGIPLELLELKFS